MTHGMLVPGQLDLLALLGQGDDERPDVVEGFTTCGCGHSLLHHTHRGPISAPMAGCLRCSCEGQHDAPAPEPDDAPWVIVSCGAEKLDRRAPAGQLYTGSYHRAARRAAAALTRPDRTLILSARHGLLQLGDEIAPYEMRMGSPGSVSPLLVSRQMRDLGIARPGTQLIVLAGKDYTAVVGAAVRELNSPRRPDREPMRPGQLAVTIPLRDTKSMGAQLAVFARIARGEDPIDAAIAVRVDCEEVA